MSSSSSSYRERRVPAEISDSCDSGSEDNVSHLKDAIHDAASVSEDYFCLLADTQKLLALTHPEKLQEISAEELDTGIRKIQLDSHLVVDKLANWDKLPSSKALHRPWQSSPKIDGAKRIERFRPRPPPRKSRIATERSLQSLTLGCDIFLLEVHPLDDVEERAQTSGAKSGSK